MGVWVRRRLPWVLLAASIVAIVAAVRSTNLAIDRDQVWYRHTLDTGCARPLWPLPDNSSLAWAIVALAVASWAAALVFAGLAWKRGERAPMRRQFAAGAAILAVGALTLFIVTPIGAEATFLLSLVGLLLLWIAYLVACARGRWAPGVAVVYLVLLLILTGYAATSVGWIERAGDPPELGLSGDGPECGCC